MPTGNFTGDRTHILPPLVQTPIKGGSAGDHTLTGIATVDYIMSVSKINFDTDGTISTVSDLTSEFSISAADTISNSGGTDTTDALLLVLWADYDL